MNKLTHTPGPWREKPERLLFQTPEGQIEGPLMSYLAGNQWSNPGEVVSIASERIADHQLCAAAPDLLIALENLKALVCGECPSLLDEDSGGNSHLAMQIDEAIAKATGTP